MSGWEPPAESQDVGHLHRLVWVTYAESVAGVNVWHWKKGGAAGEWCCGWVPFRGHPWANLFRRTEGFQAWDVVEPSVELLTLSPSIRCRACGDHGLVVRGRWEPSP